MKDQKIKIDEVVCCTNTDLYGESNLKGIHTADKKSIGNKCSFCDGTYVLKEYWIDKKYLEVKVEKESCNNCEYKQKFNGKMICSYEAIENHGSPEGLSKSNLCEDYKEKEE